MPRGGARPGAGRKLGGHNRSTAEMRNTARMFTDLALQTLGRALEDKRIGMNTKITAAKELLDRGHGKAPQQIDADVNFKGKVAFSWLDKPPPDPSQPEKS